jgi:hypothetical protein
MLDILPEIRKLGYRVNTGNHIDLGTVASVYLHGNFVLSMWYNDKTLHWETTTGIVSLDFFKELLCR